MKALKFTMAIVLLVCLSGCKKELYSDLSQRDGNEMLAILLQHSIAAETELDKKQGTVKLFVDESEIVKAVTTLKTAGYPRQAFGDFCEELKKSKGLIRTPTEERMSVVCSLKDDIARSISYLDGVIVARVHIGMPESDREMATLSSASVMIQHSSDVNLEVQVPQIKELVAKSIPDLEYDNITIALFPSRQGTGFTPNVSNPDGEYTQQGATAHKLAIGAGLLWIVTVAWYLVFGRRSRPVSKRSRAV